VVAAWMVATGRAESLEAAVEKIRARRPHVVLQPDLLPIDGVTSARGI